MCLYDDERKIIQLYFCFFFGIDLIKFKSDIDQKIKGQNLYIDDYEVLFLLLLFRWFLLVDVDNQ